jgi:hypothetical protein
MTGRYYSGGIIAHGTPVPRLFADGEYRRKRMRVGKGHGPWVNWYVNRKRMRMGPSDGELRAVSWRRAL